MLAPVAHSPDDLMRDYVSAQAARHGVPSVDFIATRGSYCAACGTGRRSIVPRAKWRGKVTGIEWDPERHPNLFKAVCSDCGRQWSGRSVLQGKVAGTQRATPGPTTGPRIGTYFDAGAPRQVMRPRPTRPSPPTPHTERLAARALELEALIEPTPPGMTDEEWSFCLTALFGRVHLDALRCHLAVSWPPAKEAEKPPWQPTVVDWGERYRPEFYWTEHRVTEGVRFARRTIERRAAERGARRAS